MTNELLELCHRGRLVTDKYIGGLQFHSYIENFYGKIFPPRKDTTKHLLEIGIAGGGSLWLWEKYFQNANINAIDVDEFMGLKFKGQHRIQTKCADAYNKFVIETIPNNYYDIIIDDGPHTIESQIIFIEQYLQKTVSGGLLIIEDIAKEEYLETLAMCVPERWQNNIYVHDTCELDNRFDSRIMWIET